VVGWTTPTEAAALGAAISLLIAAGYGRLSWTMVAESVRLTGRTTVMVCWLFIGSSLFAAVLARLGAQQQLESWILGLGLSSDGFLWVTMLIIFLLGWPPEWTKIIVIFVPIFLPMLKTFQIDPLLFGVLVAVNLQTAGDVGFLSEGHRPAARDVEPDLQRHVPLPGHPASGALPHLVLARANTLATSLSLR
jgi:TRAP-type mannitol/chloroaromatic compound transport system permease large subunit